MKIISECFRFQTEAAAAVSGGIAAPAHLTNFAEISVLI